jgi:hypothetical protein
LTWTQESLRLVRSRGPSQQRDWDLSSLNEIIGDYHRTLIDCQKLLEENHEFRKNRNFAYNTEWNLVIQPKIDNLRKRLESHNSKIAILLKPLELNLLSDVHRDLVNRIDPAHRGFFHLQGLLISDVGQALSEQGRVLPVPVVVPTDIERKLQASAEKVYPGIRTPGNFPLQAGADAFTVHFEESTKRFRAGNFLNERTPAPKQYLALLKCVWIIGCIQQSNALRNAPLDSQWPGYINQLTEDLSLECQRFTAPSAQRLIAPNMVGLRHDDEFNIWPEEDIAEFISPHTEVCLEEVLRIPMPSPSQSLQRDMSIYRLESTRYRLVESIEDKQSQSARRQEFKMDIDLKTVNLTPIYATPSSRPKPLEVLINSGCTQTNPTFLEIKQILRLQHLLTGYKVYERYDQAMVTVSFFISGQATPIVKHGRLQLWLPHPYGNSSISTSPAPSTVQSPLRSSKASLNTAMESMTVDSSRGDITPSRLAIPSSRASLNTTRDSMTPTPSRENVTPSRLSIRSFSTRSKNRPPSVMTNFSTTSRSTVTSTTTISTGTGRANLHIKPAKPLLVIFLKSQDASAKLAIAAIQIDDNTEVKRERCQCRTSNSPCRISCIERSDGCLLVQRWDANLGLGSWNLAKLGTEQRKELPENAWNDVKRVSMKFDSLEGMFVSLEHFRLWMILT